MARGRAIGCGQASCSFPSVHCFRRISSGASTVLDQQEIAYDDASNSTITRKAARDRGATFPDLVARSPTTPMFEVRFRRPPYEAC